MFRLLDFLSWPGNLLSSPYPSPSFFPAFLPLSQSSFFFLLSCCFSSFLLLFSNLFPLDYSGITSFFSFRSMILLPLSLLGHSHFAYLDRYEWCFLPLVVHHHLAKKWTGNPKKCMIEKVSLTNRKREWESERGKQSNGKWKTRVMRKSGKPLKHFLELNTINSPLFSSETTILNRN